MKGTGIRACILAAAMVGWQASADNTTNSIPAAFDFEAYEAGTNTILGAGGWYGGEETLAVVTNMGNHQMPAVNSPIDTTHLQVLQFDGEVTNPFAGGAQSDIYVDVLALPGRREETPSSNLVEGAQVAVFVNSNGLLEVFRGIEDGGSVGLEGVGWLELTNAPIGTSEWVRLTVHMYYGNDDVEYFRLFLNGNVLGHPEAYLNANTDFGQTNGTWFLTASQYGFFQELGLSGSGFLDDLLVTNGLPDLQPMLAIVAGGNAGGTVEPNGTVFITPTGSTNFTITASQYYSIVDILTNGASIGGTPPYASYVQPWTAADGSGWLTAVFAPDVTGNGTFHWYLAQYGLALDDSENGSLYDDGDGMPANQEQFAGTDPTNGQSVLKFEYVGVVDGTNIVQWQSALGPDGYAKYGVEYSTNLVADWIWAENVVRNPPTNTWYKPVTDAKLYYRITVTN